MISGREEEKRMFTAVRSGVEEKTRLLEED